MTSLIDLTLLERFSGKPDLQRRLVQMYLDTSSKLMANIATAVELDDMDQVAFHAHSLKGTSLEVGANRMAELSQQLQVASKAGDREAVKPLAGELFHCHEQTGNALAAIERG